MASSPRTASIYTLFALLLMSIVARCAEEQKLPSRKEDTAESIHLEESYPEDYSNDVSEDSFKADEHGKENLGDVTEDHSTDMHHDKGVSQEFSQGGSTYNKHHKGNVALDKELENVKQHDAGEKFGAEALKEHKLGKHKEKSKGHKLHGFKNTYHKEEYGDHKTFHDEFLDTDHHHNYDDHHEHRQLQGGKFSKGFKQEGKNKNFDAGDERHEWGKDGHDSYDDGKYEVGGHASKHHHGDKKHEGQHESHDGRYSHRKRKNGGDAPHYYSPPHAPQYTDQDLHNEGRGAFLDEPRNNHMLAPPLENNKPHYNHEKTTTGNFERVPSLDYNEPRYNHKKAISRNFERISPVENNEARYNHEEQETHHFERVPPLENNEPPFSYEKARIGNSERVPPQENDEIVYNRGKPLTRNFERAPLRINEPRYNHLQTMTRNFEKIPYYHSTATPQTHIPTMKEVPPTKILRTHTEVVPHQTNRPVIARQHQFYHRWPKHSESNFRNPSQFPDTFIPKHQRNNNQQTLHLNNQHLTEHPYSQPYNWQTQYPTHESSYPRQPARHTARPEQSVPQYSYSR